ncbi:GNAT family N-acetyltransferase [Bifidobacterium aerophilum]|uniref:GNAT family N-acetyltransferase n=1 Tax=Bifidobacterium aerophilum TaxID=1798155 RepID=A0A6N9Z5N8_9BIFI|nr:GNAT family N-acetyltransferase [Bifidobacterium aerophilum]
MSESARPTTPSRTGITERLKNLIRRPTVDCGTTHERIGIRPVANEIEAQEVWLLLAEQIAHPANRPRPQVIRYDDGTLRPTLIGAWSKNGLIGAAFVEPDEIAAQDFARFGDHDAAQIIRSHVAILEGIAVIPERRREGVGLKIKLFCDAWAAQHHAKVILGIPTNMAARRLNEKAGHTVLEANVGLVMQITDKYNTPISHPVAMCRTQDDGFSAWAWRILSKTTGAAIHIGEYGPIPVKGGADEQSGQVRWLDSTGATGLDVLRGIICRLIHSLV